MSQSGSPLGRDEGIKQLRSLKDEYATMGRSYESIPIRVQYKPAPSASPIAFFTAGRPRPLPRGRCSRGSSRALLLASCPIRTRLRDAGARRRFCRRHLFRACVPLLLALCSRIPCRGWALRALYRCLCMGFQACPCMQVPRWAALRPGRCGHLREPHGWPRGSSLQLVA